MVPSFHTCTEVRQASLFSLNETLALAYGWLTLVAIVAAVEAIIAIASCLKSEIEFPSIVPFGESGCAGYDKELATPTEGMEG